MAGISSVSSKPGTTSPMEWMLYRLMLTGTGGDFSKFVTVSFNPLNTKAIIADP